jgi:hypothetical protein
VARARSDRLSWLALEEELGSAEQREACQAPAEMRCAPRTADAGARMHWLYDDDWA